MRGGDIHSASTTGKIEYCCYREGAGADGNISLDPLFKSFLDYQLRNDSPCIDAGDANPDMDDACYPPGKGTRRCDMGAYGGPDNCLWIDTPPLETMLGMIKPEGDLHVSVCHGFPPLENPYRLGWLGFHYNPLNKWHLLCGNADGKRLVDLIQVTEYGDAWVALISEVSYVATPKRWGWLGFKYDERDGYHGWLPLSGDANGDGASDLIQVTEYSDAWVALSIPSERSYGAPSRWGWIGYRFNRGEPGINGALPLTGDANGDGASDLIQVTEYRDVWVALSEKTMYEPPTRWGWLNFYYDEMEGYYPLLVDANADGFDDLIQVTPSGEVWIAPSLGDCFGNPEYWGNPGFLFSREDGYLPFFFGY
ncbi:hypothetical protein JW926_11975 [Candidatus Sumerlaeota bacterium]|nr:hypothetical protein [Candidatus Sumerlaeota bacterium]